LSYLIDPFTYDFMQRALGEALLTGVACGLLGAFVVLRGLTFTGESLAHTLLPGAAVAVVTGLPVLLGALGAGLAATVLIAVLLRRPAVGEEAAVGVVFTGAFALGVIVLAARGTPRDLDSLLFGSILAVEPRDLWAAVAATVLVLAVCAAAGRRFLLVAFDPGFAAATGLRPTALDVLLLVSLAGALVVALRGVGTLLVLALLVGPAATARVLARRVWTMLWLAPALASLCGVAGLELSYHAGIAAGPAIALTAVGAFAVSAAATAARALPRGGSRPRPLPARPGRAR
jgi:ABC-type Mn2+/Zn2+ transport system permease subunit